MADGLALLRLLEPLVRPDGRDRGIAAPQAAPLETRSFESLLAEARQAAPADGPVGAPGHGPGPEGPAAGDADAGRLVALAPLDRIENASLRDLVGGAARRGRA